MFGLGKSKTEKALLTRFTQVEEFWKKFGKNMESIEQKLRNSGQNKIEDFEIRFKRELENTEEPSFRVLENIMILVSTNPKFAEKYNSNIVLAVQRLTRIERSIAELRYIFKNSNLNDLKSRIMGIIDRYTNKDVRVISVSQNSVSNRKVDSKINVGDRLKELLKEEVAGYNSDGTPIYNKTPRGIAFDMSTFGLVNDSKEVDEKRRHVA